MTTRTEGDAPTLQQTKACTKCREDKLLSEYNRRSGTKDGLEYRCRSCASNYHKEWRKQNADKLREYQKSWRELNSEYMSEYNRAWYEANKVEVSARSRSRHAERWPSDPEYRSRIAAANLRRRRMLAQARSEPYTRESIFERDGWVCGICKGPIDQEARWPNTGCATIDHIVPLVLGGDDTPENVQSAHGYCNFSKNSRYTVSTATSKGEINDRDHQDPL